MGRRARDIIHNIVFQVDQQAVDQTLKASDILRMSQAQLVAESNRLWIAGEALRDQLRQGTITQQQYNEQIVKTMDDFAKVDGMARNYKSTAKQLNEELKNQERILVNTGNAARSYKDQLARVRAEAVATSHVGMGIGAIGRTLERSTGLPISGTTFMGQEAFRAVRGIQLMGAELPILTEAFKANRAQFLQLAAGGIALIATLKLIEMAHSSYQDEVKRTMEAIQQESELRKRIASENIAATRDEAEANAEKARQRLAIEEEELSRLQSEFDRVRAEGGKGTIEYGEESDTKGSFFKDIRRGLAEIADYTGLRDFNEEADAYTKAIDEQKKKVDDAKKAVELYGEAVDSSTVADNTAAEARALASKQALDNIESEISYMRELSDAIRTANPDQVNSELARLRDELSLQYDALALLREQYNNGIITEEDFMKAQQDAFDAIGASTRRIEDWSTSVRDAANARQEEIEAEEAAREAFEDMIDTLKRMKETYAAMGDFARESLYIERERQKDLLEQQNDYERESLEKKFDHYLNMARMDEDYYIKVREILRNQAKKDSETQKKIVETREKFNDRDQEALREHMRRLYEIRRDAQEDILDAAARLDAVAVQQAIRNRDKQLDDEYYKYQEEQRQRDKERKDRIKQLEDEADEKRQAYEDQLEDLEDAHELERSRKEEDYQIAYDRERQEFNRRLDQQVADWEAEDTERSLHMARQLGIIEDGYDEIERISKEGMDSFVENIRTRLDLLNAMYTVKDLMKNLDINMPIFDRGGILAPGRSGMVGVNGRPELIKSFMPSQITPLSIIPGGTSKSYTFGDINITGGMTNADTAQAVIDAISSIIGP
jgi:hypothetical protein